MVIAMGNFDVYAWYLLVAIYAAMLLFVVAGGWRRMTGTRQSRLLWLLLAPTLVFASLWIAGPSIWGILGWLYVYGDVPPPNVNQSISLISNSIAIASATIVLLRMIFGYASLRYSKYLVSGVALIFTLFASVYVSEIFGRIDGWTAKSAAENYVARWGDIRLVEAEWSSSLCGQITQGVSFVAYQGNEPITHIVVVPNSQLGWHVACSNGISK
jgi:hypothetical protein